MGSRASSNSAAVAPPNTSTSPAAPPPPLEPQSMRNELFNNRMGNEAFRYVKKKLEEDPHNPELMALVGETAWLYEKVKNPMFRVHWIDRQDAIYEGLEATAKCMKEHPNYAPCYRYYTLCAVKAADIEWFYASLQPIGYITNWHLINKVARESLKREPTADVAMALASFNSMAARKWYTPTRLLAILYGIPDRQTLLSDALTLHKQAMELDPSNMENVARMAMVYYALGDFAMARKWYCNVRDEMAPRDPKDVRWTSLAHTHLATHFETSGSKPSKSSNWYLPF